VPYASVPGFAMNAAKYVLTHNSTPSYTDHSHKIAFCNRNTANHYVFKKAFLTISVDINNQGGAT
jgi:hypothetical protein